MGHHTKLQKNKPKKTLFPSLWIHLAKSQIAARAPSHCAGHEGNPGFSSEAKSNYRFTICRYLMISIVDNYRWLKMIMDDLYIIIYGSNMFQ